MEFVNTPQIGPVIQRHRKERGLTLEQLAEVSGISKSMLSQIERGQTNPTFGVLWNLTRALKIEFSDLLEGGSALPDKDRIELVSAARTPEIRSADGLCQLRILGPPQRAGDTEWYEVDIEPLGSLDSEAHPRGAMEHFTAFTSGLQITSGNAVQLLKAGETARYPADVPHRITNTMAKRAKGIVIVLYR